MLQLLTVPAARSTDSPTVPVAGSNVAANVHGDGSSVAVMVAATRLDVAAMVPVWNKSTISIEAPPIMLHTTFFSATIPACTAARITCLWMSFIIVEGERCVDVF